MLREAVRSRLEQSPEHFYDEHLWWIHQNYDSPRSAGYRMRKRQRKINMNLSNCIASHEQERRVCFILVLSGRIAATSSIGFEVLDDMGGDLAHFSTEEITSPSLDKSYKVLSLVTLMFNILCRQPVIIKCRIRETSYFCWFWGCIQSPTDSFLFSLP